MKKRFFESNFWKTYGTSLICFVLAICVLCVGLILRGTWKEQIVRIKQEKQELAGQQQIQENRAAQSVNQVAKSLVEQACGIKFDRQQNDDKLAATFFKYSTEWDSYGSYVNSRNEFLEKYPYISESSYFLKSFFPNADTLVMRDTSNEIVYNAFDNGRNIHFDSLESYVLDITEDDTYEYLAIILTHSDTGKGQRSTSRMVVLYDVSADGIFSNVEAYVLI
jgi:hypothetical protein